MRRILVSSFAAIASFSVLANNWVPVNAPTAEEQAEVAKFSPKGMAKMSDQPAYAPVIQIPVPPAAAAPDQAAPDVSSFTPHTLANEFGSAPKIAAKQAELISAQTSAPSTDLQAAKLESLPAPVETDILLARREHATVAVDVRSTVVRSASMPEVSTSSAWGQAFAVASTGGPADSFTPRSLMSLPARAVDTSILTGESEHRFTDSILSAEAPRTSFVAEAVPFMPEVPSFVSASYQAPESIFQRARFVPEPVAPVSADLLAADTNIHGVVSEVETSGSERSSAAPDKTWLPALVSTVTEVASSIFSRPRIVEENNAPVSTEILAVADQHAAATGDSVAIAGPRTDAEPDSVPSLPSFISTLAVAPSAAFQKLGLLPMPEAPAATETLLAANQTHTAIAGPAIAPVIERGNSTPDKAVAPVKAEPVLISNQMAMNADMLKPMSAGPLVNAPLPNENAIASSGFNPTPFDRMLVNPDVPEAVLAAQPTLISSKTEFSNALLKPMTPTLNPFVGLDKEEIIAAAQQRDNYCDPNFVGQPIRFSQTVELKLDDLLRQLHQRFGVNFIVGRGVADLPMNIKAGSIPWNVLLRSQLFISGVRARCIDATTIELVQNQELPRLQDGADVETRFIKLKFLQRTSSGSVDLAGRGQGGGGGQNGQGGGCSAGGQGGLSGAGGGGQGAGQQNETAATQSSSKFDKLIIEIEKILGLRSMTESTAGGQGGQGGGTQTQTTEAIRTNRFVTQIPGRNILTIRATKEEHDLIEQIIARADRPPFQVVVKGLVYTANQDKLRDIGVSTSIFGGTADGRHTGSVVGNTLGAAGTIFDFSTIIGTFDFNVQATALEQSGVLSVKSRPFSTVIDGLCARLNVGRSIPIIIDSSLGGQGALEFIDALNKLDVTPHVIDDENGDPVAVTLELTMFANDVDNSVVARGVPAISERSIQTQLLLPEDKTAILGGFTVDQASRTVEKTPGIGDIPIIGQLFKRKVNDKRVNRLYFAISVDVIPYPEAIRPVDVPGATTDIPSITPEMKKRSDMAEPKQVTGP